MNSVFLSINFASVLSIICYKANMLYIVVNCNTSDLKLTSSTVILVYVYLLLAIACSGI